MTRSSLSTLTLPTVGTLAVIAALLMAASTPGHAATKLVSRGDTELSPCLVKGARRLAQCATLAMPLRADGASGETIDVHVAVLTAEGSSVNQDPVFLFAGGPGQAAGEYGAVAETVFQETMRRRDIVLMDARGTGRSTPLQCEMDTSVDAFDEAATLEALAACRAAIDFDVRHINLETIVQDVDRVRAALGYEQINLWGGSYGTRVISHYVRRFPDRVRSVIADGVLPPDVALFKTTAQSAERAKDRLVADCNARPACAERFPDLDDMIISLGEDARADRLVFDGIDPFTGEPLATTIPFEIYVESLRSVMYNADATVVLPLAIEAASEGNLQPLLVGLMGGDTGMYIGMTLSVLCGEEVARVTSEQAEAAGAGSFAGDSYYRIWDRNCSVWDSFARGRGLPDDIHDPVASKVPALILSGDLDPITPPELGDHLARTFTNSRHIVVTGTGHIASLTGCMPGLINEFVEDLQPQALDTKCLDHLKRLPVVTGINGQIGPVSKQGDRP